MIDRKHKLPVAHQCSLLGVARSSAYYTPREVSAEDLALMRRIDEWPPDHPFAGIRLLRDLLRPEGFQAGRKSIGTLMARMGIEALYPGRTPLMKAGFLSKQTGPSLTA